MPACSGSSCVRNRYPLQAHLVLEETVTTDRDVKKRIIDRLNYFDQKHVVEIYAPSLKELPAFIKSLSQYC